MRGELEACLIKEQWAKFELLLDAPERCITMRKWGIKHSNALVIDSSAHRSDSAAKSLMFLSPNGW